MGRLNPPFAPFSVRKLYVDAVDERGTLWIFYFAELRLGFLRQRLAGAETYPCAGGASCRRAVGDPDWPAIEPGDRLLSFRMQLEDGPLEFSAVSLLPPWTPGGPELPLPIRWQVVAPRLDARLRLPGSAAPLRAAGYCDFVEIRGLPRWLGLRRVEWGRVHGADQTFVFTSIARRGGAPWRRAALLQANHAPVEASAFALDESADGARLHLENWPGPADFTLGNESVLRDGDTMDERRFPAPGERLFYRWVTGAARERRWTGSARLGRTPCASARAAVHESVDFR